MQRCVEPGPRQQQPDRDEHRDRAGDRAPPGGGLPVEGGDEQAGAEQQHDHQRPQRGCERGDDGKCAPSAQARRHPEVRGSRDSTDQPPTARRGRATWATAASSRPAATAPVPTGKAPRSRRASHAAAGPAPRDRPHPRPQAGERDAGQQHQPDGGRRPAEQHRGERRHHGQPGLAARRRGRRPQVARTVRRGQQPAALERAAVSRPRSATSARTASAAPSSSTGRRGRRPVGDRSPRPVSRVRSRSAGAGRSGRSARGVTVRVAARRLRADSSHPGRPRPAQRPELVARRARATHQEQRQGTQDREDDDPRQHQREPRTGRVREQQPQPVASVERPGPDRPGAAPARPVRAGRPPPGDHDPVAGGVDAPAEVEVGAQRQPRVEPAEGVPDVAAHQGARGRKTASTSRGAVGLALVQLAPLQAGHRARNASVVTPTSSSTRESSQSSALGPRTAADGLLGGVGEQPGEAVRGRCGVVVQQPDPAGRLGGGQPRGDGLARTRCPRAAAGRSRRRPRSRAGAVVESRRRRRPTRRSGRRVWAASGRRGLGQPARPVATRPGRR